MSYKIIENFKLVSRDKIDDEVINDTLVDKIFTERIPERVTGLNSIIDIGAHIGVYSLQMERLNPNAKVIAVEACMETYQVMLHNLELNKSKVIPIHLAVSGEDKPVKLFYDKESWGHSTIFDSDNGFEEVNSITLSDLFESNKLNECDLIKFNCEGAEFEILLSLDSIEPLTRTKSLIILYHSDLTKMSHELILDRLRDLGFKYEVRFQTELRGWIYAYRN